MTTTYSGICNDNYRRHREYIQVGEFIDLMNRYLNIVHRDRIGAATLAIRDIVFHVLRSTGSRQVEISEIKRVVNCFLADNFLFSFKQKMEMATFFEDILFRTNNYHGYIYNDDAYQRAGDDYTGKTIDTSIGQLRVDREYNRSYI